MITKVIDWRLDEMFAHAARALSSDSTFKRSHAVSVLHYKNIIVGLWGR